MNIINAQRNFIKSSDYLKVAVVAKHSTQNIDNVDISNPDDNENFHQFINKIDYEDVSINLNNGEITPKLTVKNNIFSTYNNESNTEFKYYNEPSAAKCVTLNPISNEAIIDTGDENIYSSTIDISNRNQYVLKSNIDLNGFVNYRIGDKFDAFIVDKNHTNYSDVEKLDCVEFKIKDFNFASIDKNDFHKNLHGKIKDFDSDFDSIKYLFSPYCDWFSLAEQKDSPFYKIGYSKFNDKIKKYYVDYVPLSWGSNTSENKGRTISKSLRAGVHDIGYVDIENESSENPTELNCYVGTKVRILDNFNYNGDDNYIYNNINRPLILKNYDSQTKEIGSTIMPMVAQSYKFNRDYILSKIKLHLILPSNLPSEYLSKSNKIKLVVTHGFLIDGKLNENGIVTTEFYNGLNSIKEALNNYKFVYPIFIPKGKEYFIGVSLFVDNDINSSFKIKCLENGKYDMSGNLISFPANVETKCFINGEEFSNKLLKIDLFVNTYEPYKTYNFQMLTDNNTPITFDRAILLNSDFFPSNTVLKYSINANTINNYNEKIVLKKNDEFIAYGTSVLQNNAINIEMSTNDKYVSPIIWTQSLNLITKNYSNSIKHYTILSNPYGVNDKLSSLKFRISNINCWKNEIIDNQLISITPIEKAEKTSLLNNEAMGVYYYLLRVNFDYHLNYYSYDIDQNIVKYIYANLISKVDGKRYSIWSPYGINESISTIDGNRIDIVDLNDNGWKRANCEYIISYILDPNTAEKGSSNLYYYPFISFLDHFDIEVGLLLNNHNSTNEGVEGIRNILCSVDTLYALNFNKKGLQQL